jgi:hypothetical protein
MAKFRKKPVVIDAEQFLATKDSWDKIAAMGCKLHPGEMGSESFYVTTIHGQLTKVAKGDWVILEPDPQFAYPCKPDIFEKTYEPVTE